MQWLISLLLLVSVMADRPIRYWYPSTHNWHELHPPPSMRARQFKPDWEWQTPEEIMSHSPWTDEQSFIDFYNSGDMATEPHDPTGMNDLIEGPDRDAIPMSMNGAGSDDTLVGGTGNDVLADRRASFGSFPAYGLDSLYDDSEDPMVDRADDLPSPTMYHEYPNNFYNDKGPDTRPFGFQYAGPGAKKMDRDEALARARSAIAGIEGNYQSLGKWVRMESGPGLRRGLGRYQIMTDNLPKWSKEVFGRVLSPDEFVKSPMLQDQLFNAKFGQLMDKYGPMGAAARWIGFGVDANGTSTDEYGRQFAAKFSSPKALAVDSQKSAVGRLKAGLTGLADTADERKGQFPEIQDWTPASGFVTPEGFSAKKTNGQVGAATTPPRPSLAARGIDLTGVGMEPATGPEEDLKSRVAAEQKKFDRNFAAAKKGLPAPLSEDDVVSSFVDTAPPSKSRAISAVNAMAKGSPPPSPRLRPAQTLPSMVPGRNAGPTGHAPGAGVPTRGEVSYYGRYVPGGDRGIGFKKSPTQSDATRTLYPGRGMRGDDVTDVQRQLVSGGYLDPAAVNGHYDDPRTIAAVRAFQKDHPSTGVTYSRDWTGLPPISRPDGITGPRTQRALGVIRGPDLPDITPPAAARLTPDSGFGLTPDFPGSFSIPSAARITPDFPGGFTPGPSARPFLGAGLSADNYGSIGPDTKLYPPGAAPWTDNQPPVVDRDRGLFSGESIGSIGRNVGRGLSNLGSMVGGWADRNVFSPSTGALGALQRLVDGNAEAKSNDSTSREDSSPVHDAMFGAANGMGMLSRAISGGGGGSSSSSLGSGFADSSDAALKGYSTPDDYDYEHMDYNF